MDYLPFKDISYAQGAWDMDTDSDPIVAMKASGVYTGSLQPYLDTELVRNYADAIRLGKVPIMYHFAGGADAATEAAYFIAAIHPLADGDVYALDWEIDDVADPVAWVNEFTTAVHTATGAWPFVYMDISRLNQFNWTPVLENCGLWLAAPSYGFDETIPEVNHPYIAQQGPIVNGVDTDAWFDTLETLDKYAYHSQTSTPVPAPQPDPAPPEPAPPTPEPTPSPAPDPTPTEPTPDPTPTDPNPTPTDPTTPPVEPTDPPVVTTPVAAPTNKGVVAAIFAAILAAIAIVLGLIHH